jgi:hypothetical protein
MPRSLFYAALLGLLAATPAAADDKASAIKVVGDFFTAMKARDSAALRALVEPGAALYSAADKDGQPQIHRDSFDEFIAAVAAAQGDAWDERIVNPEVRTDGGLASVWTEYDFYLGSKWSHCGIDAFQLAKGPDGFKVIALSDTRRKVGCARAPKP